MRRFADPDEALITKVNVTPIIDVALVLVIILLVTAPMMSVADLPVDLPTAHTREAEDERNLSITMAADGQLALDETPLAEAQLPGALAAKLAEKGNQDVLVVIRADTSAPYEQVGALMETARRAGAKRVAIATRQATEPSR
jgi:biopolymer transport protein ExbD